MRTRVDMHSARLDSVRGKGERFSSEAKHR